MINAAGRYIPVNPEKKIPAIAGWADPDFIGADTVEAIPEGFGVGIVTGRGLAVIDVDDWAVWRGVCAREGEDPETPSWAVAVAETPSGGAHFYFTYPLEGDEISNANTFPEGVDVRGAGGFVVAPPTPGYSWV